jgi:hypothetical protein
VPDGDSRGLGLAALRRRPHGSGWSRRAWWSVNGRTGKFLPVVGSGAQGVRAGVVHDFKLSKDDVAELMVWEAGGDDVRKLVSLDLEAWQSRSGNVLYCALEEVDLSRDHKLERHTHECGRNCTLIPGYYSAQAALLLHRIPRLQRF